MHRAAEASRQHDRVGELLAKGCLDDELKQLVELGDATVRHLAGTAASRDPVRHHGDSESLAKRLGKQTPEQRVQVQVEFEL